MKNGGPDARGQSPPPERLTLDEEWKNYNNDKERFLTVRLMIFCNGEGFLARAYIIIHNRPTLILTTVEHDVEAKLGDGARQLVPSFPDYLRQGQYTRRHFISS